MTGKSETSDLEYERKRESQPNVESQPKIEPKPSPERQPRLELSLLTSFDELESIEDDWGLLHATSARASLTNSFSYVYMAYQHFLSSNDSLYFITIRDFNNNQLVALFPFVVTDTKQYDFNFKTLSFLGLDKFKKPSPLLNQSLEDECWNLVLSYTLRSNKVWQMMDLGEAQNSPLKKRSILKNLQDRCFMRKNKDVSYQSFIHLKPNIQLKSDNNKESDRFFIKDGSRFELLNEYQSNQFKSEYDFKVYTGEDLDYCFSQIMLLATKNQNFYKNNSSQKGASLGLELAYDFYQKYFCRMAYKNNLSFGLLLHKGQVISIEIGYTEANNLYLDSNLVDADFVKRHADVLSLSLFLKVYSEQGFSQCEFLCADDSRIPFLNANTRRIEKQMLSKLSLKLAFAFSLDLCSRTSHKMECKVKQMLGLTSKVNA